MTIVPEALGVLADAAGRDGRTTLADLAEAGNRSPSSLHRRFRAATGMRLGDTVNRMRLHRAAAALATTDHRVIDIALDAGYESHEGFTRAFGQRFGTSPSAYRARLRTSPDEQRAGHAAAVVGTGICAGTYRIRQTDRTELRSNTVDMTIEDLPEITLLVGERDVPRDKIPDAIGECLGAVMAFAGEHGIAVEGRPLARYPSMTMGSVVIQPGFQIPARAAELDPGDGLAIVTIPAGPAAVTIHYGAYDEVDRTYTALETAIRGKGYRTAGAAREIYLTDPGENPDPSTWQTQIVQPVESAD